MEYLDIFSLVLALILGFMLHRSGLCMVRTVAEILTSRRAYMLAGILKSVLSALSVFMAWSLFTDDRTLFGTNYGLTCWPLLGGFLFGLGAGINGGCAFSTLSQLVNGRIWMLTTLAGFSLGIAGMSFTFANSVSFQVLPPLLNKIPERIRIIILILLVLLFILEIFRLWRSRPKSLTPRERLLSRNYRQSTYSLIIGICGGLLCIFQGNWTYTSMLKKNIQEATFSSDKVIILNLYLFFAVFVGMVLSVLLKGGIQLQLKPTKRILEYLIGGTLMGIGAVLIPGGNDTLILKSIPGLSLHAAPTLAALLCGVAVTLYVRSYVSGKTMKGVCKDDMCMVNDV